MQKGVVALYSSVALSALTLFGVGYFKGTLSAKSPVGSGVQFLCIAVGAAGVGYLIGLIVQYFFPGIQIAT
jgi:VIT1/CCC1 family predicted Fe2+/Mn2+ transporter